MANRQDSGSNSAHENQRPTSHNEDAVPEMTDTRNRAEDDSADEFEAADESDEEQDEEDGSF